MSKFCPHCGVFTKDDISNCVLCGKYLGESQNSSTAYAPENLRGRGGNRKIKTLSSICFIVGLVSVIVNLFIFFGIGQSASFGAFWSIYPVLGMAVTYFCVLLPIKRQRYKWKEIFSTQLWMIICVVIIDLFTDGNVGWSIFYVIPFLLTAVSIAMLLIIFLLPKTDPANALLNILCNFLLSLTVLIMDIVFVYCQVISLPLLIPIIAFLIPFVIFAYFIIFRYKEYVKNLFKKFHV